MQVKLTVGMAGHDFSHAPGEVIDVDKATAKRLLDSGQAEAVADKPARRAESRPNGTRGESR